MSARNPHDPSADECKPRIVTIYRNAECLVAKCIERGYPVRLHAPEINAKTISLEITSTRGQRKAMQAGEGDYFDNRTAEWKAQRLALCERLKADIGTTRWKATLLDYDRHHGRTGDEYRDRRTAGQEYQREDENAVTPRLTKCTAMSDLVIQVAMSRELRVERVSYPADSFVIVKVWATLADYRAAQFEWLQKMIATQSRPKVLSTTPTLDLFA